MSVYRLKPKQRGAKCSWCGGRATHRGFMFGKFACLEHLSDLQAWDKKAQQPDYSDAAFYGGFE
jgi:hypothetical protein